MTHRSTTVSVVIPVFNGARYLAEAVSSIRNQTCPASQIIVVDDGSTDDTAAAIRAFGEAVTAIGQPHQGIGAARNRGVSAAAGTFIAFLDADDLFNPGKLAVQLEHLQRRDAPDISFGHVEEFVADDLSPDQTGRLKARARTFAGGVPGAMVTSRETFNRVGLFDTSCRVAEFADWYLRAQDARLHVEIVPDVVLRRRLHVDNVGVRHRESRADYARIVKRALDRRRSGTQEAPPV